MEIILRYWQLIVGIAIACLGLFGGRAGFRLIKKLKGDDPDREELVGLRTEKEDWLINKEFLFDEAAAARIVRDRNSEQLDLTRAALRQCQETVAKMKAVLPNNGK